MKTKTLHQLCAQIERIHGYFDNPNAPGQAERLNRACKICNRYGCNIWHYLNSNKIIYNVVNIPVPMSIYAAK